MPFVPIDPVVGPECTRCGCRDAVIVTEPKVTEIQSPTGPQQWIAAGKAICKHCDQRFQFRAIQSPERQLYAGPSCPDCGCGETKCTRTYPQKTAPIIKRWHQCKQCGGKFVTESTET